MTTARAIRQAAQALIQGVVWQPTTPLSDLLVSARLEPAIARALSMGLRATAGPAWRVLRGQAALEAARRIGAEAERLEASLATFAELPAQTLDT